MKLVLENYGFLVYMHYMHPAYQTSIFFGSKNCAYYIQIFTVYKTAMLTGIVFGKLFTFKLYFTVH